MSGLGLLIALYLITLLVSLILVAPLTVFVCPECDGWWRIDTGPKFEFNCPDCGGEVYATKQMPIQTLTQKVYRTKEGDSDVR
jgi:transcription initiation factor IIE alpha subunit